MSGAVPNQAYAAAGTRPQSGPDLILWTLDTLLIQPAVSAAQLTGGLAMNMKALDALGRADPDALHRAWAMINARAAELTAEDAPHAEAAAAIGWLLGAGASREDLDMVSRLPPVAAAIDAIKAAGTNSLGQPVHDVHPAYEPLRRAYADRVKAIRAEGRR
ncbi:MAG: hypothetical protein AAF360_02715 [Pseudomonadota bacterium]